jgi:hypothetical protein
MEDIMKHPWMNQGYPCQLGPSPFPNFKTVDQLNGHILERMVDNLGYDREAVVHNVCHNKASPDTATYHLMDTMFKNIARRHRLSDKLRTCLSEGQIDVELTEKPAQNTRSKSLLPTKPGSAFKDAAHVQALNLKQPLKPPVLSEAPPVTQLSAKDAKIQSHAEEQLDYAAGARVEVRPRRGSTSTLPDTRRRSSISTVPDSYRRFGRRLGLKLSVANPANNKSNKVITAKIISAYHSRVICDNLQTKTSTIPKWALGSRPDQSPSSMRSARTLQIKRTTSDQIPPTMEPGTEIYSLTGNVASVANEDPQKLPSINGSSLVGSAIASVKRTRSVRTRHQMKS